MGTQRAQLLYVEMVIAISNTENMTEGVFVNCFVSTIIVVFEREVVECQNGKVMQVICR